MLGALGVKEAAGRKIEALASLGLIMDRVIGMIFHDNDKTVRKSDAASAWGLRRLVVG